jgi:hypothetical protein
MDLGWLKRLHGLLGLVLIRGGEQLVGDDGSSRRLLRLSCEDLPLAGPRARGIAVQLLDPPQVLAPAEVILRVMPGQHDALLGERGAITPYHLLQEGRAGLRLADMQEDLRPPPGSRRAGPSLGRCVTGP